MKIKVSPEEATALTESGHLIHTEHYLVVEQQRTVATRTALKKKAPKKRKSNRSDAPARAAKRKRNIGTVTRDITVYRMLRKSPKFNTGRGTNIKKAYEVIANQFMNGTKTQTRLELAVALESAHGCDRLKSHQRIAALRAGGYLGIVTL